jgi:hypothetical protein
MTVLNGDRHQQRVIPRSETAPGASSELVDEHG